MSGFQRDMRRNIVLLGSGAQAPLMQQQLGRWPGPQAGVTYLFAPRLGFNAGLKSYGYPADNAYASFPRPDVHPVRMAQNRRNLNAQSKFNAAADNRGIPAVYVPTSLRNAYNGFSTW